MVYNSIYRAYDKIGLFFNLRFILQAFGFIGGLFIICFRACVISMA